MAGSSATAPAAAAASTAIRTTLPQRWAGSLTTDCNALSPTSAGLSLASHLVANRGGLQFRVARLAKFPFPLCHDDGGQAIADDVGHGARHVHQLVDAEDERDAGERQVVARERA